MPSKGLSLVRDAYSTSRVKVLAFARCDVSISADGTSIIVVMIIVAPNR